MSERAKQKTASEVLAGALKLWGSKGTRWTKDALVNEDGSSYCLIGGLSKAAVGYACYADDGGEVSKHQGYLRARQLVGEIIGRTEFGEANPHTQVDHDGVLFTWNDDISVEFSDVKAVVCKALKKAVAEEGGEE